MTKTEILEAIDSTIITNGQKGITADSLRNILTEMTKAAGEGGSGEGILRIMVPSIEMRDVFANSDDSTVSAANWETYKENLRGSTDDQDALAQIEEFITLLDPVYETMFAHNAEVYQTLSAKTKAGESTIVLLDDSAELTAIFNALGGFDEMGLINGQLGFVEGAYIVDGEFEESAIGILPMKKPWDEDFVAPFEEGWHVGLNPDGTLMLTDKRPKLYLPETYDVTLTDDQKNANAALWQMVSSGFKDMASVATYYVEADGTATNKHALPTGWVFSDGLLSLVYFNNYVNLAGFDISSDGSTTFNILGSISPAS